MIRRVSLPPRLLRPCSSHTILQPMSQPIDHTACCRLKPYGTAAAAELLLLLHLLLRAPLHLLVHLLTYCTCCC